MANLSLLELSEDDDFVYPVQELWTEVVLEFFDYQSFHSCVRCFLFVIVEDKTYLPLSSLGNG